MNLQQDGQIKVGIAGAGGIGSSVAHLLVRSGVRHLTLVDFDRVEASNLNRQFYFHDQIGMDKTVMLSRNLKQINPQLIIEEVCERLDVHNIKVCFSHCDIIVEGVDDKKIKKKVVEAFAGTSIPVICASGIAGTDLTGIGIKSMGNITIVGDLISDEVDNSLFPPKVHMVAALMAAEILKLMGSMKDMKMKSSESIKLKKKALPQGVYGILAEKFSLGRDNVTVARLMIEGGIDVIQYREKRHEKSMQKMYEECLAIREITREAGVPFIVNDFADLALMVKADGVHVGQDDLPVTALRDLVGEQMMIGCSTNCPAHAEKAIKDGADYIGVGPIFATQTKEDVSDVVGLSYLNHVATRHTIPFAAIGGIKKDNLADVLGQGARCVCLVTEIVGASDIPGTIREIKTIFKNSI